MKDGELLDHGWWVVVRCVAGCIYTFRRQEQRRALLGASAWKVSCTKAHCTLRHVHHSTTQREVVVVLLARYPDQRHQVLRRGLSARGKVTITHGGVRDHKFCFLLLNFWLIHSLNAHLHIICSPHTLSGVPRDRGAAIYVHTLLDKAEGEFVWNDMIHRWKTCWTSGI